MVRSDSRHQIPTPGSEVFAAEGILPNPRHSHSQGFGTFDGQNLGSVSVPSAEPRLTPSGSTSVNFANDSTRRSMTKLALEKYRLMILKCQPHCILCITTIGVRHTNDETKCIGRLCYKCLLSGHRSNDCPMFYPNTRQRDGPVCYACGLVELQGIELHVSDEFGRRTRCPMFKGLQICVKLWFSTTYRQELIQNFNLGQKLWISDSPEEDRNNGSRFFSPFYDWLTSLNVNGDAMIFMDISSSWARRAQLT